MKRRVVVTGMGAVTPLGVGVETTWRAVCQGKSGIGPITRFDASPFKCQVGGEVKEFHPEDYMERKLVKRLDRFIHLGLGAARLAMEDAGLKVDTSNEDQVGVVMGTALGAPESFEVAHSLVMQGRHREVSPFFMVNAPANMLAGVVAIQHGARGVHRFLVEACATGSNALGLGFHLIRDGEADAIIAGGCDAGLVPTIYAGFDSIGVAASKRNHQPEKACRPFDRDRDGLVSSEGAGVVILEALELALRRGAKIYAEIIGFGSNCDAYHFTSPQADGEGPARCMRFALRDAGILPQEVDYINAHGTSTLANDVSETRAIKKVFGDYARRLAVSSTKSMTGHMWGAAGAVEAMFSILAIREGIIPPTINYEFPDPECDLDYVPNELRRAKVRLALSNSFGFGGVNGCLLIREFQE